MTHRVFSRNSASSRAIPIERMIKDISEDPFIPEWWGKAQPGMQAFEQVDGEWADYCEITWLHGLEQAIYHAIMLMKAGLHKQVVNRLLEPWMHIEVVLSGTEFTNFFMLRRDEMAEPHIRHLANDMWKLYHESKPVLRGNLGPSYCRRDSDPESTKQSEWHLPFIVDGFRPRPRLDLIKESVAHAAWVSYGNAAGKEGFTQEDVNRVYEKLVGSQPIHASPLEHVAVACNEPHRHGNFVGWCQWRKFVDGESGGDY